MVNESQFTENSSGELVTKSKIELTDSDNMGHVDHTSYFAEILKDPEKHKIQLISFIEKRAKLGLWKADEDIVESDRYRDGDERVKRLLLRGQRLEKLFQTEIEIVEELNRKNNRHVPKIIESKENYYKMVFVNGIPGDKALNLDLNFETRMPIVLKTLRAARDVFADGVVNLEHAPKNTIIVPNLKTGKAEEVKLIDFGVSFQIDEDGDIEIDMDVFEKIVQPHLFPPEAIGKKGKVKINAEKCLVWSLARRVVLRWFFEGSFAKSDIILKALSKDPEERCSLEDLISFIESVKYDEENVASCIPEETLKENQQMLGRPDSEIIVSQKQVDQIAEDISNIKERDAADEKERLEKLRLMKEEEKKIALQLTGIANEFIDSEERAYGTIDVVQQLEKHLEIEIKTLYDELKERIDFTDLSTILDSVSIIVAPENGQTPPVVNMFPKFYRLNPELGMDSALSSSILKLAIEEKRGESAEGHKDYVNTAFFLGHQVVITTIDEEHMISILDPSETHLGKDGKIHGFVHSFTQDQVANKENSYDGDRGWVGGNFRIEIKIRPEDTSMFEAHDSSKEVHYQDLSFTSVNTLIDLSVMIHNLARLADKSSYPSLNDFNAEQLMEQAEIYDHEKVFK